MARTFSYEELPTADLVVDAVYEGTETPNLAGEALSRLLPGIGNQGGFRAAGRGEDKRFVVLHSSGEDQDWPDHLDPFSGRFLYYGDNKRPGHELHDTQKGGNRLLRRVFDFLHGDPPRRKRIPPFFVFTKYPTRVSSRSFQFRGLAVPGYPGRPSTEDLVAIWKTTDGLRFQNYRAYFSILDIPHVSREWISELRRGGSESLYAPSPWTEWCDTGTYRILESESTTNIRDKDAQIPETPAKRAILETVYGHFGSAPHAFEEFAAQLFSMHDQRVVIDEITRPTNDGGRDAVGRYLIGLHEDPIYADFSLEAKCWRPPLNGSGGKGVGVKEVARLVSRIRHRQFGVMVTTSFIGKQAYEEIRGDRHPIIFICGKDVVDILTSAGLNTADRVKRMLERDFPT